jgi:hypothetical protein
MNLKGALLIEPAIWILCASPTNSSSSTDHLSILWASKEGQTLQLNVLTVGEGVLLVTGSWLFVLGCWRRISPTTEVHADERKRGEIQILVKKDVPFPTSAFPRLRVMISFNLDFGVRDKVSVPRGTTLGWLAHFAAGCWRVSREGQTLQSPESPQNQHRGPRRNTSDKVETGEGVAPQTEVAREVEPVRSSA